MSSDPLPSPLCFLQAKGCGHLGPAPARPSARTLSASRNPVTLPSRLLPPDLSAFPTDRPTQHPPPPPPAPPLTLVFRAHVPCEISFLSVPFPSASPPAAAGAGALSCSLLSLSQGLKLALELGGPANAADSAHGPSCRELSLLSATPGQAEPGASRRRPLDPCPPHPAVRAEGQRGPFHLWSCIWGCGPLPFLIRNLCLLASFLL